MKKDNYYILTGAMGSGKSTVLKELKTLGMTVVDEPARQIISEQRSIHGRGLYDKDAPLFCELMLSRSIAQHNMHAQTKQPTIFDRSLADNICYMELFGLDATPAIKAAQLYQCHRQVFMLPAWQAIYTTDEDRTMSFEQAKAFGESLHRVYLQLGYDVLEVPKVAPFQRAEFILAHLASEKS